MAKRRNFRPQQGEKLASNKEMRSQQLLEVVANVVSMRKELVSALADPRRDIDKECGYPESAKLTAEYYQLLYDREPLAARVVDLFPTECWRVTPTVYELEDSDTPTAFEQAWDNLGRQLRGEHSYYQDEKGSPVWEYLKRVDTLSGIGQFGVMFLGIDDGLPPNQPAQFIGTEGKDKPMPDNIGPVVGFPSGHYRNGQGQTGDSANLTDIASGLSVVGGQYNRPLNGYAETQEQAGYRNGTAPDGDNKADELASISKSTQPLRKLLFIRVFPQCLVQVTQVESNPSNPRFQQPVMYLLTLGDFRDQQAGIGLTTSTIQVHWTRIIHIADNRQSSEVFGVPRMRPVLNPLLDIKKVRGSSAEGYWGGAFPALSLETAPTLGGDVDVDVDDLKDMMEDYYNGLQRFLGLIGWTAKTISPTVADPTAQLTIQMEAICIKLGCPKRIFMGSERGELSSAQDSDEWKDRINQRQDNYLTPHIITPFVDRLICLGILPCPKGFSVEWPDMEAISKGEQADIATKMTTTLTQYIAGGGDAIVSVMDFLTRFMQFSEEEAAAIIRNAAQANAAKQQKQMQLKKQGMQPGQPGLAQPGADTAGAKAQAGQDLPANPSLPGGSPNQQGSKGTGYTDSASDIAAIGGAL